MLRRKKKYKNDPLQLKLNFDYSNSAPLTPEQKKTFTQLIEAEAAKQMGKYSLEIKKDLFDS